MKKKMSIFSMLLVAFLLFTQIKAIYCEDYNRIVYVSRTGTKYHYSSICSDMKNPIAMTLQEAINKGKKPCIKCVHETPVTPPTTYGGFSDVYADTPHRDEIVWLANNNISKGWSSGSNIEFRPYNEVARADMAAFIRRLAKMYNLLDANSWTPTYGDYEKFIDVNSSVAHAEDILWLAHQGISEGWLVYDEAREFRPYQSVARCDMAAFLRRLLSRAGISDAAYWSPSQMDWLCFKDIDYSSPHAEDVIWLAHAGISQGWIENNGLRTFRPYETVKRCDMAAFLKRLIK